LRNPVSDALALRAMNLIARWLPAAVEDGSNANARDGMMTASLLAGMAFGNADVAGVHCLAEAIGGRYDTPHGVANSVFLPVVFAHNTEADPERHAVVAEALGIERGGRPALEVAADGAAALAAMARTVGIPHMRDLVGIDPADFPELAAASAANVSNSSNCRPMDEAAYLTLLETAWNQTR
jgi:alcohol dehydrogenase